MADECPTAEEIRDTLVQMLVGTVGETAEIWRERVGEVAVLPVALNRTGNWFVSPNGTPRQIAVIKTAIDVLREAEPYAKSISNH